MKENPFGFSTFVYYIRNKYLSISNLQSGKAFSFKPLLQCSSKLKSVC